MQSTSVFQILWGSSFLVKLTLLILFGFSVMSWAIVIMKFKNLKNLKLSSTRFFAAFSRTQSIEELLTKYSGQGNPFFNVFRASLTDVIKKNKGDASAKISIEKIQNRIQQSISAEIEKIEEYLPFLATTGSTTPFIGLFGTVWGILEAFWQIGRAGSSSLAVVGPFIAEALVTTAIGLAAAIPAVIFYNFFTTKNRGFVRELENFGDELKTRIQTEYL